MERYEYMSMTQGVTRTPAPVYSDEVREFYERHPYPAPIANLDKHRELYHNPVRRRAQALLLWPAEKFWPHREILIAGCGTSQAAKYALREPDAHITAINISETSLKHNWDLQRRHSLRNLDLHHLPIERVGELGRRFDQIVCTGVLHHLPDPDMGLRSLRNALAPTGGMHLMIYATYGRAGIYIGNGRAHRHATSRPEWGNVLHGLDRLPKLDVRSGRRQSSLGRATSVSERCRPNPTDLALQEERAHRLPESHSG